MQFIVAVDENWGIGKDGGMLDHLPKDLAFFKETTSGHVVVMGRKTLESFPGGKPLPNRLHIVLTNNLDYSAPDGVMLVHSLDELAEMLDNLGRDDVFVIGGASVYATLLDVCSGGYVTHIGRAYEGVQKYFPNLDEKNHWQLSRIIKEEEDKGRSLRFCYYENKTLMSLEEKIKVAQKSTAFISQRAHNIK